MSPRKAAKAGGGKQPVAAVAERTVGDTLQVATPETVEKPEFQVFQEGDQVSVSDSLLQDPKVVKQADQAVRKLLNRGNAETYTREQRRAAIDNFGGRAMEAAKAASESLMLQETIQNLNAGKESGGGEVAGSLVELTLQVERLDPVQLDQIGWFSRLLGRAPLAGPHIKKYFMRFESCQIVIQRIRNSMHLGAEKLRSNNQIHADDQQKMREATVELQYWIAIGRRMDDLLAEQIAGLADGDERLFVEQQLLFPLRQRIQDLFQQLLVNQQGFLALEMIVSNNRELIRGVQRADNVTITALNVAVAVALALNDQAITLDKIEGVNRVTSDMIANTSRRLRTQGVRVHKQAASSQLEMGKLKESFADLKAAIQDVQTFHSTALPTMQKVIAEMGLMAADAEKAIRHAERGSQVRTEDPIFGEASGN
ncbi:MAG TPA: toxic anion resistance protein [Candidatus Nanoarchaeia archaeon]|nr:toxic anion resistance protein [Candidatus Nanoarchaeia archaeon]